MPRGIFKRKPFPVCQLCPKTLTRNKKVHLCTECDWLIRSEYRKLILQVRSQNLRRMGVRLIDTDICFAYNLTVEKDNIKFAQWLYATRGTEDWYASKSSCWSK